jgi:Holliday junction resolvasome RuvABC endonuclease subunit
MNRTNNNFCVLAIAPSTVGFGFAVLDGDKLVDWGIKTANGNKNRESLRKLEAMIIHYKPGVLVLEDYAAEGCQRRQRIKSLGIQIVAFARKHDLRVRMVSRQQVKKKLLPNGKGNKDDIAESIAKRFPEELGPRLPRKRKSWMREAYQMGIFDALALALIAS